MKSPTALCRENIDSQICRRRVEACLSANIEKQGGIVHIVHCARAHLQAFRDRSSLTHTYTQVWPCTLMTICGATLPHLSHYKEEACDNAVIYFIAPSLRLVWSLPLCTSLSVYISRQILSSRRLGFREQAPLFTHITCMCLWFLCLHGEMLPDVIQLQAFYGIFWVSGFSSLSWAEVPLNFTLKLLS